MPGLKNGVPIVLVFASLPDWFQNVDNGPNEEADALYLIEQLGKRCIQHLHMSGRTGPVVNRIPIDSAKKVRARFPRSYLLVLVHLHSEKAETLIARSDRRRCIWS